MTRRSTLRARQQRMARMARLTAEMAQLQHRWAALLRRKATLAKHL